jgi:DNA-binding transcriptional LysR family regulator
MQPLMQQCYDMAQGAQSLAKSIKRGEIASLRLALSHTVDISLLMPYLSEFTRAFNGLELNFQRGTSIEVAEKLKQGDAELGIAGPLDESWARFDVSPLFTEGYSLVVSRQHKFAGLSAVDLDQLSQERLLLRPYCEQAGEMAALLRSRNVVPAHTYELFSEHDLLSLLQANMGVAVVPISVSLPERVTRVPIKDCPLRRTVYVYAVSGRARKSPVTTFMRQLHAADWTFRRIKAMPVQPVGPFDAPISAPPEARADPYVFDNPDRRSALSCIHRRRPRSRRRRQGPASTAIECSTEAGVASGSYFSAASAPRN